MRPDGIPSGSSREAGARLFFALWPPPDLASDLHARATTLAKQYGGRAMRCDTLHLTLAFLGEVSHERIPLVRKAADQLDAHAFSLSIDQFGFWPHNRILWAGSATISRQAEELAACLCATLQNVAEWPIRKEARSFVPHLTLIRNVAEPTPVLPPLPPLRWQCDRFVLVRSQRSSHGADYEHIGEWRLR